MHVQLECSFSKHSEGGPRQRIFSDFQMLMFNLFSQEENRET
jgi:hypothetical protein